MTTSRRRRRALLAAIGLICLAFAAWRLLRRGGEGHAAARSAAHPIAASDRPRAAPGGDEPASPPLLSDDDPRGDLRLEGQVVDADDHPVGGATVVLGSIPARTAVTAGDGGFAFDGLVGRPYTLIARARQGGAGPITARLTSRSDPVVLHLRPAARLTVTAIGLDGKPVDGASVELRGADEQREITKAGVATFATVVPGGYQLAAWGNGTAKVFQWLTVRNGDNGARVVLVAGAPVSGRVIDDRGKGVAGARVIAFAASAWNQQGDPRRDGVATGPDGTFRFEALPAGTLRLLASHLQLAPAASPTITLDGKTERGGITITLPDGAIVRGRVVDPQRRPVAGAAIRIAAQPRGRATIAPPRRGNCDANGEFELRGLPRRPLIALAMNEAGSSRPLAVDASRGDPPAIDLVIDQTGTIGGVVVDPSGTPLEGVQVSAAPSLAGADGDAVRLRGGSDELTDGAGTFLLRGLPEGNYTVTATRVRAAGRARPGPFDGQSAHTGQTDLKIVLQPEGAVKGKVAFTDGTSPAMFVVSIGQAQQAFTGVGSFELDALAPQAYSLGVRGPFQSKGFDITIEPGKTTDLGTILVARGRTVAGIVTASGSPVGNATVYAGRLVLGNGSTPSSAQPMNDVGQATRSTTTADDGTFSLTGFIDGDLAIIAERDDIGRSKTTRIPTDMPEQGGLSLELLPFGALSGTLRQGGAPAEGVVVTVQSTTAANALYTVASGPDGRYRFDRLAPDTYKVSATLGSPRRGWHYYSKQVDVAPGSEVAVDLAVEPGPVTLEVTAAPRAGQVGTTGAWLATGVITATRADELAPQLAAQGPGASQSVFARPGTAATFTRVVPGPYTACVVPLPSEVQGRATLAYFSRHIGKLPAYCQQLTVAPSPLAQSLSIPVDVPPYISDGQGSGSATR